MCLVLADFYFAGATLAQVNTAAQPPIELRGRIAVSGLSFDNAPTGLAWERLDDFAVAILRPEGWYRHAKNGPFEKIVAFSETQLNDSGQFDIGLTVQLIWNPRGKAGGGAGAMAGALIRSIVQNKTDNTVLSSKFEEKVGKKVAIMRHRNAPEDLPPIIVHRMMVIDPVDDLLFVFTFESPEQVWEEKWKIGEQLLKRVFIGFRQP